MRIELATLDSPLGGIVLAVGSDGVCALDFAETEAPMRQRLARSPTVEFVTGKASQIVAERVQRYFAGDLGALEEIAVSCTGTPFQQQVWAALRKIRVGETASYQTIARAVGRPTAVRAVGAANGQNAVALVVPCHRVIASDGTLCGYAGGLWRKEWLLGHERAVLL